MLAVAGGGTLVNGVGVLRTSWVAEKTGAAVVAAGLTGLSGGAIG